MSGHELQVRARLLQSVWVACGHLIDFVAASWPEKRSSLSWCAQSSVLAAVKPSGSFCQPAVQRCALCVERSACAALPQWRPIRDA